jgi:hypothetical protein
MWREHADLEAMIVESRITAHDRLDEFQKLFNTIDQCEAGGDAKALVDQTSITGT